MWFIPIIAIHTSEIFLDSIEEMAKVKIFFNSD